MPVHVEPSQRMISPRSGAAQTSPERATLSESIDNVGRYEVQFSPSHAPTPWLVGAAQIVPSGAWAVEVEESVSQGHGSEPQLSWLKPAQRLPSYEPIPPPAVE